MSDIKISDMTPWVGAVPGNVGIPGVIANENYLISLSQLTTSTFGFGSMALQNSNAVSITGGNVAASALSGTVSVINGGTGASTAATARVNLLPAYAGNANKVLAVNASATDVEWIVPAAASGTVTSVNVSGGSTGLSFSGGPISTSGTITMAGTLAVASGGTGASTANIARNNLGAAASGANSDITSITGLTTALSVPQGGTGAINAGGARTNLGATTVGSNFFTLANPGAVTFPRINADNSVSTLDAATLRSAIGAGTGDGTVTSVSGAGAVNGITLTGSVSSSGSLTLGGTLAGVSLATQVTGTLPVANGGTGQTSYLNGQLLIGNSIGSTLTKATLTAGSGISISNGPGSITITATGGGGGGSGTVTSVDVSGGTTGLTTSGGPITTSGTITIGGTLGVANGGTGATTAANARVNLLPSYTSNAGKVLAVNVGATDVEWIAVSGTGTVTSVGGTGSVNGITLTGSVTTSGNLTLGGTLSNVSLTTQVTGTLPIANGGTGQTTYTDGQLLIGNSTGNTLTKSTLTAGSGITITNGAGSITIAATGGGGGSGTVTSVDVSGGTTGLTFSGGPVTTSGTITMAGTLGAANGGTGTSTAFTAGSVVFAGASGVYSQDNANLFWDDTNNRLGVGTATPAYTVDINGSARVGGALRGTSGSVASAATITPASDTTNQYNVTALATGATLAAPSGTPVDGQKLTLRIKDNGTARVLTWTTGASGSYREVGATLPGATVANKTVYVGCIYNAADLRWDVVAVSQEA